EPGERSRMRSMMGAHLCSLLHTRQRSIIVLHSRSQSTRVRRGGGAMEWVKSGIRHLPWGTRRGTLRTLACYAGLLFGFGTFAMLLLPAEVGAASPKLFARPTDLGTLGGTNSGAGAVNGSGQVVGESDTTGNTAAHAFSWTS